MPAGAGDLILLVDDEAAVRETTKATLEAYGYRTLVADNGATALAAFAGREQDISLVITDMMMPVMGGAATISALRQLHPQVCAIATTGLAEPSRLAELEELQVAGVLEKPYDAEALLRAVARALREHRLPAAR